MVEKALKNLYQRSIPATIERGKDCYIVWIEGVPEGPGERCEPLSGAEIALVMAEFTRQGQSNNCPITIQRNTFMPVDSHNWMRDTQEDWRERERLNRHIQAISDRANGNNYLPEDIFPEYR